MDVGKCFEKLHRVLMDSLDSGSDTNDAEIRKMIDALILKDEDVKKLSLEERVRLGRDLFSSVRRLDVLQELIDDKKKREMIQKNAVERSKYYNLDHVVDMWENLFHLIQ